MAFNPHESKLYSRFASIYDAIFERFFVPRIRQALVHLDIAPGHTVLDLGVGTGISLPLYPDDCHVVAMDLSFDMLHQARRKVDRAGLGQVNLVQMNALELGFADNTFDEALVSFVVSVVPDPQQLVRELQRVVVPGGRIAIVNHFRADYPLIGQVEDTADHLLRRCGWVSNLTVEHLLEGSTLRVEHRYRYHRIWDLWTILVARNDKA